MEAKHTPGPWRIQWGHESGYPLGISTWDRNIVNAFGRPAQAESVANAKLIAAAPELLAVAGAYLKAYESHHITNTGGVNGADMTGYLADLAREAIAKATS